MQTFGRLLSVLTFLLSLGFIAQAMPAAPRAGLAVRQYNSPESYSPSNGGYTKPSSGNGVIGAPSNGGKTVDVLAMVTDLKAKVDAHVVVLAQVKVLAEAKTAVEALVVDIKACAAALVDVKIDLGVEVKTKIAVAVMAMISAIVKVCAAVSVKVGVQVCLALWAQIDVALHLLILTLKVCIPGFLKVIIDLGANLDDEVIVALKVVRLDLCAKMLVIVKALVVVN
ncbi:unnamed protein product [Rhizoctonia solani]|uniref:Transmembrane protein n=1 Tax=Rhizoctonia solani TaxID=456999 RepID=A0A8H2Y258_9AGAM|nr:unnamed protein product [Rhizoctonia solani]